MKPRRNTRERIIDIAEDLFAQKGFAATSISEIAVRVGISSPGIYKHFSNKLAIYEEVCQRLFAPLADATAELNPAGNAAEFRQQIQLVLTELASHPNIARLVQHATLAQDETLTLLTERWYQRFFSFMSDGAINPQNQVINIPAAMAFHCMILGYVTLAPLHKGIFGTDPLKADQLDAQLSLQQDMIMGLTELTRKQRSEKE